MSMAEYKTLDELLAEDEVRNAPLKAAELAKYDSPEEVAKRAARRADENERYIRSGQMDAEGNWIENSSETEDDEDSDEDGDDDVSDDD
jgi:hypothetical protein